MGSRGCADTRADCTSSGCCTTPKDQCFQRDATFAACAPTCNKKLHRFKGWTCKLHDPATARPDIGSNEDDDGQELVLKAGPIIDEVKFIEQMEGERLNELAEAIAKQSVLGLSGTRQQVSEAPTSI